MFNRMIIRTTQNLTNYFNKQKQFEKNYISKLAADRQTE